jgi:hypothetical protein
MRGGSDQGSTERKKGKPGERRRGGMGAKKNGKVDGRDQDPSWMGKRNEQAKKGGTDSCQQIVRVGELERWVFLQLQHEHYVARFDSRLLPSSPNPPPTNEISFLCLIPQRMLQVKKGGRSGREGEKGVRIDLHDLAKRSARRRAYLFRS